MEQYPTLHTIGGDTMINREDGKLKGSTTCQDLIDYVNEHMEMYGNTSLSIVIEGGSLNSANVQFEHYTDHLALYVEELDEEEEE